MSLKGEELLKIFENAKELNDSAIKLEQLGKAYHAAHMAALSIEESSKCLILLPKFIRSFDINFKNQHQKKEFASNFFIFLYQQLSIGNSHILKWNGPNKALPQYLSFFHKGSKPLFTKPLFTKKVDTNDQAKKSILRSDPINILRLHTVYTDIKGNKAISPQERVDLEKVEKILVFSDFCIFVLDAILNNHFSSDTFQQKYLDKVKPLQQPRTLK